MPRANPAFLLLAIFLQTMGTTAAAQATSPDAPNPATEDAPIGDGAGDSLTLRAEARGNLEVATPTPQGPGTPAGTLPTETASLLMTLNADLQILAASSSHRYYSAARYLLASALSATFGALTWGISPLPEYFFLYAGAGLAAGLVDLLVRPDTHHAAVTFQHMPMSNATEAAVRLHYGESALRDIAHRSRIARFLGAAIEIGVGSAVVPILLSAPAGVVIDDTWGYLVVVSAGAAIVTGAISLFVPTDAELRWRAYSTTRRLEGRAAATAARLKPPPRVVVAPIRGGALAAVAGRL